MLHVYLGKKPNMLHEYNDGWFDINMQKIDFNDSNIRKIMKDIDNVDYAGDLMFYSKYNKRLAVSLTELSTGCKTAINVYAFPDELFTLAECGDNALNIIFGFKKGKVYVDYYIYLEGFNNSVIVRVKDKKFNVASRKELDDIISLYFEEVYNGNKQNKC